MTITVADIRFLQSERMTDESDGGGKMTAIALDFEGENQIFDDPSDQDRTVGELSLRKIYAACTSDNTDKYLDAGVAVLRAPDDPATSVLLFSTGNHYDTRADLQSRLEQTVTRGPRYNGWLYGAHQQDQRALLIWQRPAAPLPSAGSRLELVLLSGQNELHSQFVWVTRVSDELRTMYEAYGERTLQYDVRVVTCELAEPLNSAFAGIEPSRGDPANNPGYPFGVLYNTRYNAATVPLYGVRHLVEAANQNTYGVKVAGLQTALIPTGLTETALPDVTPGGDTATLVAGRGNTVTMVTTSRCIGPSGSLFLGSPFIPGSLSISVSGATLADQNGTVTLAGAAVGLADYSSGVIRWNSACPDYGVMSKTIQYQPAARPLRVADTAAHVVTAENRGYIWIITLSPIPAPGSLRISYRVNGQWLTLWDQGNGQLIGADSSYGSALLTFSSGTVVTTLPELPDVGSLILYAWGTTGSYQSRGGSAVAAPVVRGKVTFEGIAPTFFSVSWADAGGTVRTLVDNGQGALTGAGGAGGVSYAMAVWWVRPDTLPPVNAVFTVSYSHGVPIEQTFSNPLRDGNDWLHVTLSQQNLLPGSVEITWNLAAGNYLTSANLPNGFLPLSMFDFAKSAQARDNGSGLLVVGSGQNGTVDYVNGALSWLPDVTLTLKKPVYAQSPLGSYYQNNNVLVLRRSVFSHWESFNALVDHPRDGSGTVTVRYRVAGSNTSVTETLTLTQLEIDLTPGYGETIVGGSTQFRIGGDRYVDTAGLIYLNPSAETGAGILAGTLDNAVGTARLTSWTPGTANAVTLDSMVTDRAAQPVDEVVFRTVAAPLRPGTLQLRYKLLDGVTKSKNVDSSGVLEDSDVRIEVDALHGVVRARFGRWRRVDMLSTAEMAEVWYDPLAVVLFAGVPHIWQPIMVMADSIVYNAVAQITVPPDSQLLGINAARLPPDGKALIFDRGRQVLIHHTDQSVQSNLSPTQVIATRPKIYLVAIIDSAGNRLDPSQYSINRDTGSITMSAALNLAGYVGPYTILHTIADRAMVVSTDIGGGLQLNKPLSRDYPSGALCSGILPLGTLQARVSNTFSQSTWTGIWQATRIGDPPLAQYNEALFPIRVTNAGAYPDEYLIQFTSATAFRCVGQRLGVIGVGDINTDFSPVNPLTVQAYLFIDYRGWGAGWATGNCLRLRIYGATAPVDVVRAIQPSESLPVGVVDSVELLLCGNVDA